MTSYAWQKHIDQSVASRCIIETPGFDFFRCDRNVNGGGVLVATKNQVRASDVKLDTFGEEMVIIRLPSNFAICCYYRPHDSLKNFDKVNNALHSLYQRHLNHKVILLGDMNLPGIDWTTSLIKNGASHKCIQQQFINMLHENSLTQIIRETTHIHGNTLDLLYVNDT